MAKNLKARVKNFFESMNNEESKESVEESNKVENPVHFDTEHTLTDEHLPDVGTPENPHEEFQPKSAEEKWMHEAADWKDKYLRLYADFDNFRKRSSKERSELFASASSDVIKEMIPILDDFDRAIKANEQLGELSVVKEGFVLIHQKLYKKLESKGLTPLNAIGQLFDTDFHEAITQVPAPSSDLVGKVIDEVEKGYLLNEKVIRFSKVVIGQ